jgi:hypothetical protein
VHSQSWKYRSNTFALNTTFYTKKEENCWSSNPQYLTCQTAMPTILCLGPRGSGKTLLLNALKNPDSVDFNSHSISTHGTNLFHIKIPFSFTKNGTTNSKKANANNNLVQIRELGGKMAPLWRSYYSVDVDKVVFVVDTSNLCQIAAASE